MLRPADVAGRRVPGGPLVTYEEVLAHFPGPQRRAGNGVLVRCPGHEDSSPSLLISERDGKILLNCKAGCANEVVVATAHLRLADLFIAQRNGTHNGSAPHGPLTLAAFAEAKQLPEPFLRELGVLETTWSERGRDCRGLQITYRERDGVEARQQRRRRHATAKLGSSWITGAGSPIPYGRWRLDEAMERGELLLVEGETDALSAWLHNVPCLGIAGAEMVKTLSADDLAGIELLRIIKEPDRGGETFVANVRARISELGWSGRAFVVTLAVKDLNELHCTAGPRFADELQRASAAATPLDRAPDLMDHAGNGAAKTSSPVLVRLADVESELVEWCWVGRIAYGKSNLVVGDPGLGKSQLMTLIAARVSAGTPWPDGGRPPLSPVLMLTAEDGLADTVRPRLDSHGGDPSKVSVLTAVRNDVGAPGLFSLENDLAALERAIDATGARVVTIDPLAAYLAGNDSHNDGEVRAVLAPLAELAERRHIAVVAVMHLTKGQQKKLLYRAQGSIAFVAAARVVLAVGQDPDVPGRRLLVSVKNNLSQEAPALAFRVTERGIVFEDRPVAGTADALLESDETPTRSERREREDAKTFLRAALATGPVSSKQLREDARANGIAERTLWRAKSELGVDTQRAATPGGKHAWYWFLNPATPTTDRVADPVAE